jgi:copper transport protein
LRRRVAVLLFLVGLLVGSGPKDVWAHSGVVLADPTPGAALPSGPREISLAFSERPEPSLSYIRVLDASGANFRAGSSVVDGLTLRAPLKKLDRGTYTVGWHVVSAVDGHATSGSYRFGVGVKPAGSAASTTTTIPSSSLFEGVARFAFLVGLVALLGASIAGVAGFGGPGRSVFGLAAGGFGASIAGLGLLAEAQRRTASSSYATLFETSIGHALIWRAVALLTAGVALAAAWRAPRLRRAALLAAALATLAVIAVHVHAGHAAAGPWSSVLTVSAQVAHFAAAGVWFGGLAALLLGIRGVPSAAKAAAVRRFAVVAAGALAVVVATGTLRAIDELSSVGQLFSSGYGRAVLAKIALVAIVAGIAARSRRNVTAAAAELDPLRRSSKLELALAVAALAVAALLGTLAPPAPAEPTAAPSASSPRYFVSVERVPGRPPKYTMQVGSIGYLRIEPDPERPGPSMVRVTCYTAFGDVSRVSELVLTAAAGDGPARQQSVRRLGSGRFAGRIDLAAGPNTIGVVALTEDGTRLRGDFSLQIPGG